MPPQLPFDNFDVYKVCREEGKHEFEVLAGRLNTFITSQAFLVSAYAVAMNNPSSSWSHTYRLAFPIALSIMGLVLSVRALPGILAACLMIRHWHRRQDTLLETDEMLRQYYALQPAEQTKIHLRDIWFAQTSPYIFGTAWIFFGCLAAYFGLRY